MGRRRVDPQIPKIPKRNKHGHLVSTNEIIISIIIIIIIIALHFLMLQTYFY